MSRRLRIALCLALAIATPAFPRGFRAAAAKIDITPDTPQWLLGYQARQSTGIHDRLYHRIAALDDGATQFFLVSTDLAVDSPSFHDEFCRELQQETGITPLQIWWSFTHTHSAPELGPAGLPKLFLGDRYHHDYDHAYAARVKRTLLDGIKDVRARLVPARLAIGTGTAEANINRRERNAKGRIVLGKNPTGPVDRQINLLRLERRDGALIALVANYPMHGTVLSGKNTLISGDAPGLTAAYVESKLGAPMLYINGAAGNIAPFYSVEPDFSSGHLDQFRTLLGDRILEAAAHLEKASSRVQLRASETFVETPRRAGLGWLDELSDYQRTPPAGPPLVRFPVRYLRLRNDTILWAAPLELFCEIAMDIRARSPIHNTFYFGYTNGCLLYLPTKRAFAEGGYEPGVSIFTDQAESDFTRAVLAGISLTASRTSRAAYR